MAATNEVLIQKVFQEMLKCNPSLQKILVAEDDKEENLDKIKFRLIFKHTIIDSFYYICK